LGLITTGERNLVLLFAKLSKKSHKDILVVLAAWPQTINNRGCKPVVGNTFIKGINKINGAQRLERFKATWWYLHFRFNILFFSLNSESFASPTTNEKEKKKKKKQVLDYSS
jgi:hypothetical protein